MKHLQRELPLLFEGGVPNDAGSVLASLFTVSIVWWSCNHLLIGMNGIRTDLFLDSYVRLVRLRAGNFAAELRTPKQRRHGGSTRRHA